ncbi:phytochrome A-associated F-box protein-like protein [Carex littledalei]|uniref:Phytochrome A-associated F-box protein-like protein n=1 Tax=Carex littledalei TaxID=544730 RepID=A0A833RIT9_9POAL|nr:phytochrome A-associated F-box protein-like protein [Carex littledalei]
MAILSRFPRLKFLLNCFSDSGEAPSPISLLPDELLLKIFSMIPPADDPGLLPRLSGVSRHFRRLLHSPLPASLSLHKLTFCCPGILHAGVLVPYYPDFYRSDHEKLYLESSYDLSETLDTVPSDSSSNQSQNFTDTSSYEKKKKNGRRRKWMGPTGSHMASGNWSLSREQDFNKTKVWERINKHHNWMKVKLNCVYCECNEMWNLAMGGCLNDYSMSHEDGLLMLRVFVCDNGHVSGAWKEEKPWYYNCAGTGQLKMHFQAHLTIWLPQYVGDDIPSKPLPVSVKADWENTSVPVVPLLIEV